MAVLVGGENYALSSKHQKKCIFYVKLTDTSLRALEEYLRRNHHTQNPTLHGKPTIQFDESSSGKICIPRDNNGDQSTFRFNVSSINECNGPQGSFECLQSYKPSSTLESIGSLQEKITVNASDDAYTRFGQKMVEVKKENEKRTTQFLDNNKVSNKLSNKLRHQHNKNPHHPSASSSSSISSSSSLNVTRHLNSGPSARLPPSSSGSRASSPSTSLAPTHPIMDRKRQNLGNFQKSSNPPGLPNISRRPLRERIVHHLAVAPLKKLELFSRLQRDGLRDKDKKCISQVIKQVSVMKDNTYTLFRHLWNDVSEDWPYYTEQDRASFRRRKPQNLTPPVSDGGSSSCSSGHSPSSTNPASPSGVSSAPPPPPAQITKRSFPCESEISSKKKRVSNYQRQQQQQPVQSSASHYHNNARPQQHHQQQQQVHQPSRHNPHQRSSSPPSRKTPPDAVVEDSATKTNNWLNSRQSEEIVPPSIKNPITQDFLTAFTPIKDKDQRAKYKIEFNAYYKRYLELYTLVEKVSKRFAQLEEQLNNVNKTEGNEEERKKLKEIISKDYETTNNDPDFVNNRKEFIYLHEKLAHIKKLVADYDNSQRVKSSNKVSSPVISAAMS